MDALCGASGAGRLIQEIFMSRAGAALATISYRELDYIFGHMNILSRSTSESYSYDPGKQMLTADQWNEVRVKDQWFRARIKAYFDAISTGATPLGVRKCVFAALGCDADLYEVWRYVDAAGLGGSFSFGRANARNELVIRPHKETISPQEFRQARDMLKRMMPVDTIVTITTQGLGVTTPVPVNATAADTTYYEVEKLVTPSPVIATLPAPELLAIDLDPSEQWLFSDNKEIAPYAAYNMSSEYGYYYLVSGGARSPIDSVTYEVRQADGTVRPETNFSIYQASGQFAEWTNYETADAPDNYPGGKFGLHPDVAPAINRDGTEYVFLYHSQAEYVAKKKAEVLALGGIAEDDIRYRLPIEKTANTMLVFTPDLAVAYDKPTQESTVTTSWTSRRNTTTSVLGNDQVEIFTRTTE